MKRIKTGLALLCLWLVAAVANAAIVWAPTWNFGKSNAAEHVSYIDHSSNCISRNEMFPIFVNSSEDNSFSYYMASGVNTSDNPGKLNVEYILTDKVVLYAGSEYTLGFNVNTNGSYIDLNNANAKVQLRDGTTSEARVIKELGDVDLYFNSNNVKQLKTFTIDNAPAECYVCIILSGDLYKRDKDVESSCSYSCKFSDFHIDNVTGVVEPPVITKQLETTLNIDVDNMPTLSIEATGEGLIYDWYNTSNSNWSSVSCNTPTFTNIYPYPKYKYKCVVSNPAGKIESEIATIQSVTIHGKEFPKGSGKYYTSWSSPEIAEIDKNTVAYKVTWNEAKDAFRMERVNQDDQMIPRSDTSGGVILQSSSPDFVLSIPNGNSYTTSYKGKVLSRGFYYAKDTSFTLGFKNGKMGMYPGEENENVPLYSAIFKTGTTAAYPDGIRLSMAHTVTFDKNADDATGTMDDQTIWDDEEGKAKLTANAYERQGYVFNGWKTFDGYDVYTDAQLISEIPEEWGDDVTLYAQWKRTSDFTISSSKDWDEFRGYVENVDNTIGAKLTADITVSSMVSYDENTLAYSGTFDGCGHTLTFNCTNDMQETYTAPFRYVGGATIKNLRVEGTISTNGYNAAGIIGCDLNQEGKTKVENCVSNVHIIASTEGEASHAGIAGLSYGMTITDCAFTGSITSADEYQFEHTHSCAGFVGWGQGMTTIKNCLLTATFDLEDKGNDTFGRGNINVENCYYLNKLADISSTTDAKQITSEQLMNGEALASLGGSWGFTLGTGDAPEPYQESKKETPNYIYNDGTGWVCENMQIADKEELNIGLDFTAKTLNYNRAFTVDDGYYTVYAPFAIPTANGKLYACTGVNADKSQAEFTEVTSAEPNTAYIFLPSATKLDLGTNVEVKKTTGLAEQTNCLRGVYSLLTFTDENRADCYGYAAQQKDGYEAGAFVKFGAGATVPSGRAYIYAPEVSGAKTLRVVIGGETTDISIPVAGNNDEPKEYYNLSGQRVNNGYKGIVVSNGKKTVRR